MGYDTEYVGYLTIAPPLNSTEVEWLSGFADWGAAMNGDPFHLPMNPRAAVARAFQERRWAMASAATVPAGVRDWRVDTDGDRISWRRSERSNDAVRTLRFLVEYYLGPEALAKSCGSRDFADFTFDHRLDGIIAASRDDADELFLITVVENAIDTVTLVPGRSW